MKSLQKKEEIKSILKVFVFLVLCLLFCKKPSPPFVVQTNLLFIPRSDPPAFPELRRGVQENLRRGGLCARENPILSIATGAAAL